VQGGARAVAGQAVQFSQLVEFLQPVLVNGAAGIVSWLPDRQPFSVIGYTVRGGRIVEIDVVADRRGLRELHLTIPDDYCPVAADRL
jgi:RNA polymerase sigma-70 factor (ECF subfamily)